MNLSKALFVAIFAVSATAPALANEPVKMPAEPIVAEAPIVAPTTEVLPTGDVKKEEGKIEEKKEELKQELPSSGIVK